MEYCLHSIEIIHEKNLLCGRLPFGFEIRQLRIDPSPAFSLLDHIFEFQESFKRDGSGKFYILVVEISQDVLIEKS